MRLFQRSRNYILIFLSVFSLSPSLQLVSSLSFSILVCFSNSTHYRLVTRGVFGIVCLLLLFNCTRRLAWDYHWQELPKVSFLSRQKFCRANTCLSRQNYVCRDKHTFVATKDVFCLSKCVCRVMGVCGCFHRTIGFKGLKELLFGKRWYFPREVVICLLER